MLIQIWTGRVLLIILLLELQIFAFRSNILAREIKRTLNLVDGMDLFQVKTELNRFFVFDLPKDELPYLRLVLKKVLLEELKKIGDDDEGNDQLYVSVAHQLEDNSQVYRCFLIGCCYAASKHREYVKHIRTSHPRVSNIACNFKHKCARRFLTIDDLIAHLRNDHSTMISTSKDRPGTTSRPVAVVVDYPVKCNMSVCASKQFSNLSQLLTHFNTFHIKHVRYCVFHGCDHRFNRHQRSSKHFKSKHLDVGHTRVKDVHLVMQLDSASGAVSSPAGDNNASMEHRDEDTTRNYENEDYDVGDLHDVENCEPEGESEDYFLKYYADFLNRLAHVKFVPHSTVQEIAEEYYKNSVRSQEIRRKNLRQSLNANVELSENRVDRIVEEVIDNDFFVKAQEKLNTPYKRNKFVQENFNYIEPVEVLLNKREVEKGAKKDVFHYVPMVAAMINLLEDQSFQQMMSTRKYSMDDKVADIQDSSSFKNNKFFQENPDAMALLFYSDGVEIKNPLGSARGTYKVVQVFYTLANISKNQRSQVDRLQLAMVFREKLLKKYSYEVIYKRLVDDLIKLEGGILVNFPDPKLIKIGLLLHAADNLEAHLLGGFSGSFSSKSICRFCHCQYADLETHIHSYDGEGAHKEWTKEEYEDIVRSLPVVETAESIVENEIFTLTDDSDEESLDDDTDTENEEEKEPEDQVEKWGIKSRCPLNVLQAFHCVGGFPPDLMHDLLEGVIPEDLLGIIRTLASKGWFSVDDYNKRLKDTTWKSSEANDKPQSVPVARQVKKLKGKALSHLVHIRNFPLLVDKFVRDKDDEVLALALKLHEVVERATATEFEEYEIDLLDESIIEYLESRKNARLNHPEFFARPKPKHHFMR